MQTLYLTSAGKSSPKKTQGTGPRPTVKTNVKTSRHAIGSQDPAAWNVEIYSWSIFSEVTWMMTDSGSCVLRKKTVPNKPMQREHSPVEAINNDLLPAMLTTTHPIVAPITWTDPAINKLKTHCWLTFVQLPTSIVAWNSSSSIAASSKMMTV